MARLLMTLIAMVVGVVIGWLAIGGVAFLVFGGAVAIFGSDVGESAFAIALLLAIGGAAGGGSLAVYLVNRASPPRP